MNCTVYRYYCDPAFYFLPRDGILFLDQPAQLILILGTMGQRGDEGVESGAEDKR